jgi:hypothetical protein
MTGISVFVGAISTTTLVAAESAGDEVPNPLVAVTDALMKYPTSNSVTTYELPTDAGISEYSPVDVAERFH